MIEILLDSNDLEIEAREESTLVITCAFTDEDGDAVIPSAITWSLTDADGTEINSRTDVAVAVPASSINVVLSGNDLAIQSGETADIVWRYFIVEAVYDSDLGSDLPLKDQVAFKLQNLKKIS